MADFSADCPGQCDDGHVALEAKIQAMVQGNEKSCSARAICQQPNYINPFEQCGCRLECRITLQYS